MKFDLSGFDEIEKTLKNMQKEIKNTIEKEWSLTELFTSEFMKKYTKYNSIDELLNASPFDIKTQEDFNNIDIEKLDAFIKENTDFNNWEEFSKTAGTLLAKRELKKQGFDFE